MTRLTRSFQRFAASALRMISDGLRQPARWLVRQACRIHPRRQERPFLADVVILPQGKRVHVHLGTGSSRTFDVGERGDIELRTARASIADTDFGSLVGVPRSLRSRTLAATN